MGKIFETVASEDNLRAAWRQVRRNKGMAGGDGVTIEQFAVRLEDNLRALREAVLTGCYLPGPLLRLPIRKKAGGMRILAIPSLVDRIMQTSVVMVLNKEIDGRLSEASYAYRPNRSAAQAVAQALTYQLWGYEWVLDGDIEAYFDSIRHGVLQTDIKRFVPCRRTRDLIALWLHRFSPSGIGIPQGAPISPLLANLYLDPVDRAVHGRRTRLVRYADDFLVLTTRQARAMRAWKQMETLLAGRGLRLNAEKTRVRHIAKGRIIFLGHWLGSDLASTLLSSPHGP